MKSLLSYIVAYYLRHFDEVSFLALTSSYTVNVLTEKCEDPNTRNSGGRIENKRQAFNDKLKSRK